MANGEYNAKVFTMICKLVAFSDKGMMRCMYPSHLTARSPMGEYVSQVAKGR